MTVCLIVLSKYSYLLNYLLTASNLVSVVTTEAVLGRQNTSEQSPPNMAAANFVVITNGEGCALNGTAVAAVLIPQ